MGNLPNENSVGLDRVLKALPAVPVSVALQQNILASFDVVAARRSAGFGGIMRGLAATIWPGAPAWRPAAALAFSLTIGVAAGTLMPLQSAMADGNEQTVSVALDAPPAFDLDENS